ncbi:MAG: hypothetical protein NTY53_01070 [Kiritimatiellaeota bacterium]|nr:hypothetical protein [Kiritimatiellota bacterium]
MMALLLIVGSGCGYVTTSVNNIGLRETWGNSDKATNHVAVVLLKESKMTVGICVVATSEREDEGKKLGVYSFNVNSIQEDRDSGPGYHFGRVKIKAGEATGFFDVNWFDNMGGYEVSRRFRKWYWYPAQTLQVIALPVDFIVGVFWFGAYGVSELTHAKPASVRNSPTRSVPEK